MLTGRLSGFVQGLAVGFLSVLFSGLGLVYLIDADHGNGFADLGVVGFQQLLTWTYSNLGLSIPLFALVLVLFIYSLRKLRSCLREERPMEEVAQIEHMVDIWTGLFFGLGVIWTAIGMRSALLYALGEPLVVGQEGAHALLQRMVDGGILLALSTTIFGGIGGYLMRVIKALTVGALLKRYYDRSARTQGEDILSTLVIIEGYLQRMARQSGESKEITNAQTALGEKHGGKQGEG